VNVDVSKINSYLDKCKINTLTEEEKAVCDQAISLEEIGKAIDNLKINKSPGLDGLTPEFYMYFKDVIAEPLHEMLIETYQEGELPDTLKKAVVTLIFKKGDEMKLENYRPIALSNYDYKILAFILASRIQCVISSIVNENQTAYIRKRYLGTNVRLIQDVFEYCNHTNNPGIIVGLDLEKAFDSLEWLFMISTLKKFNFGDNFIRWIQIIYNKPCTIFKNNGWLTGEVHPTRGIRQGCPVSALLFILSVEILASRVRENENINGICVDKNEYKICQHADDSFLLLADIESLGQSLKTIREFSELTGTKLNKNKSQGIWLGEYREYPKQACDINFTDDPVRCLGIYIGHNKLKCHEKNWNEKIEKIQRVLNMWKKRELTLLGKVTIVKTVIMSKLVHNFSLLATPENIISAIDKMLCNFIWKKKHRIKRNTIIAGIDNGGISMVDTMCKNMSVKASWIKRIKQPGNWTGIFSWYLQKCGVDLDYMLKMNVKKENECLIYSMIPQFYREVLLSFNNCKYNKQANLLNTHDYLSSPLMGNVLIKHKGKCLYLKNWLQSNIRYVKDLYDKNGNFMNETVLQQKLCNKTNWIAEYTSVKQAVGLYKNTFNTEMAEYTNITTFKYLVHNNKCYDVMNMKSKQFYDILINKKIIRSHMESVWSREFDIVNHVEVWSKIYIRNVMTFPIRKVAEFNYKILQNILCTGYILNKWNKACSANCSYCKKTESPKHLLFECIRINKLWNNVGRVLGVTIGWKHIVIGIEEYNQSAHFINICISLIGFIIYSLWLKCSMQNSDYNVLDLENLTKARLLYYGNILEETKLYKSIGTRIIKTFS